MKDDRAGKIFMRTREDLYNVINFVVWNSDEDNPLNAEPFRRTQACVRRKNPLSEGLRRFAFPAKDNPNWIFFLFQSEGKCTPDSTRTYDGDRKFLFCSQ
jgi:hypothetical protein